MIERFRDGTDGRRQLIEALSYQYIIRGEVQIAETIADSAELHEFPKDTIIIKEDASDNEIYFILSGRVIIEVHGRQMALRGANTHFGEMAMIDTSARRSASVIAAELTVTARVAEAKFSPIANAHPNMWRYIAMETANRLRERNKHVRQPNPMPVVFMGSSKESIPVLEALASQLDPTQVKIIRWPTDVFWPSHATIEDLEETLPTCDYSIFVFGPDDIILSREIVSEGPRDNVLVETGMFLGGIGRNRTYFVKPKGSSVIKIPSDFLGLTSLEYEVDASGGINVTEACEKIIRCVQKYGVR